MNQQTSWETQCYQLQEYEYVLSKISYAIYRRKSLKDILNQITIDIRKIIGADRILIYHKPVANLDTLLCESLSDREVVSLKNILYSSWNSPQILYQLAQGKVFNPLEIDSSIHTQQLQLGIQSELIVPILVHDRSVEESSTRQLWGMLVVHQCHSRDWQPFELNFLSQVGMQAAIAIQQAQLLTQFKAVKEELKRQKIKDDLTHIANRHYFDEIIEIEWKRLQRESFSISLILCQVDNFQHYHRIYGSAAGDSCLQLVAAVLLETAKRPADLVARYDEEIFAILLPNTHLEGAVKVAETIRTRVKLLQIPHQDSPVSGYITMSLGVTSTRPTPIQEVTTLIKHCEKALKHAKKDGDRVLIQSNF